jgi:hypothetical protein
MSQGYGNFHAICPDRRTGFMNKTIPPEDTELSDHFHFQRNSPRYFGDDWIKRDPMRVQRIIAKRWLLENKTLTMQGRVYWLEIQDLGLGICAVDIAPPEVKETKVVKQLSFTNSLLA